MTLKIIGLDTETSGLEQEKGHRIIEIALLTYDLASRKLVDKYVQRIDPERAIDPGAQAVHGITYSDLVGQPKWDDVAQDIADRLSTADLLIAHNMQFDGPFIAAELQRVSVSVPNVHSLCTMQNARWACPDGKLPKLSELCFALGIPYDHEAAHSAFYDVDVMMQCFFQGIERGFYELPKGLRAANPQSLTFKEAA
jgi:DNA polymerase-3 subunit epsilon